MNNKTVDERVEALSTAYGKAQEREPILRAWWLLEALDEAKEVRALIEEEIRELQRSRAAEAAAADKTEKPPAGEGGREGEAL